MPPTGALVQRRWLLALLSSSFALALCSWIFRRSLRQFTSSSTKGNSWGHHALSWLHWFLTSPSTSSDSSSAHPALPASPTSSIPAQPSSNDQSSSSLNYSQLDSLSTSRISGNPKVVVLSTRHILFSSGEGSQVDFLPDALESLKLWLQKRRNLDLYLITQCQEDFTEAQVSSLLQQAQLKGLNLRKVLFCSSSSGLMHMARQIEPELFIDSCVDNLVAAKKWVRSCVLLGSDFPQAYSSLAELVQHVNQ